MSTISTEPSALFSILEEMRLAYTLDVLMVNCLRHIPLHLEGRQSLPDYPMAGFGFVTFIEKGTEHFKDHQLRRADIGTPVNYWYAITTSLPCDNFDHFGVGQYKKNPANCAKVIFLCNEGSGIIRFFDKKKLRLFFERLKLVSPKPPKKIQQLPKGTLAVNFGNPDIFS